MAHRLTWLPEAIDDLDAIASRIAVDSHHYANDFVARVISKAEGVCELPAAGHITPEAGSDDIREIPIYPYRLIYRLTEDKVIVLAVLHGSRLIGKVIRERLS